MYITTSVDLTHLSIFISPGDHDNGGDVFLPYHPPEVPHGARLGPLRGDIMPLILSIALNSSVATITVLYSSKTHPLHSPYILYYYNYRYGEESLPLYRRH